MLFWTAFAAIGTVGAFAVLIVQLWLLRRDRKDDYLRALIPFVSIDVHDKGQGMGEIPITLHAHGGAVAYNVLVNLKSSSLPIPGTADIPSLRQGAPAKATLTGDFSSVAGRFLGELTVGFFDVFGNRHEAYHTVNTAPGYLQTTDWLHWRCVKCRVHPRKSLIERARDRVGRRTLQPKGL